MVLEVILDVFHMTFILVHLIKTKKTLIACMELHFCEPVR